MTRNDDARMYTAPDTCWRGSGFCTTMNWSIFFKNSKGEDTSPQNH